MPTNVEIKARAASWNVQLRTAEELCESSEELMQEDTFYHCKEGRLKLRVPADPGKSELIYYQRPDQEGPKSSRYWTSPVPAPHSLKELLSSALGERTVVRKRRRLFLIGQTRVHFDEVYGLGRFIELEVCMHPHQTQEQGEAIARDLMAKLHIAESDLLQGAYADMRPHG